MTAPRLSSSHSPPQATASLSIHFPRWVCAYISVNHASQFHVLPQSQGQALMQEVERMADAALAAGEPIALDTLVVVVQKPE